ncbi:hypothetical protein [Paraburkholderia saeva]|uniref:hypothetical protein n=1 Tax=Paraburkholderia saeva TaxID=2777537 RepID=UPI001E330317|nr:hypothetical protein [Paraburkholderia saeva]
MIGLSGLAKSCVHAERRLESQRADAWGECKVRLGIPEDREFSRDDQQAVIAQLNDKTNPLNYPDSEIYKCRDEALFFSKIVFSTQK